MTKNTNSGFLHDQLLQLLDGALLPFTLGAKTCRLCVLNLGCD